MLMRYFLFFFVFFPKLAFSEIINFPEKSGLTGFFTGGLSNVSYKSNMYRGFNNEYKNHNGIKTPPEVIDVIIPTYGFDFKYTFSETKTQFFMSNSIKDAMHFDFAQQVGFHQKITDYGVISIGYLFPLVPSKTWKDPYSNREREETKINITGARVSWDQILGTPLNATYTERKFDVQDELSGETGGLIKDEQDLLNRNGNSHEVGVSYDFFFAEKNLIHPEVKFLKTDFYGKAMNHEKITAKLSYGYTEQYWSVVSEIFFGQSKYIEENPIFKQKESSNDYGFSNTTLLKDIFDIRELTAFFSFTYEDSDSNINFYDSYASSVNVGLVYSF